MSGSGLNLHGSQKKVVFRIFINSWEILVAKLINEGAVMIDIQTSDRLSVL